MHDIVGTGLTGIRISSVVFQIRKRGRIKRWNSLELAATVDEIMLLPMNGLRKRQRHLVVSSCCELKISVPRE